MLNTYNQTHSGHLPVRVLQHNIISAFESVSSSFLNFSKRIIKENGLVPDIGYTINKSSSEGNPIIGPHVKNEERKIYIDETFLAYIWCVCYVLYVESNNLIRKSDFNSQKSNDLFSYAKKLQSAYVDWDKDLLINPELYCNENKEDVEKTNAIFQRSISFILCHEFFHVESGHIDSDIYKYKDLSQEMAEEKLENEYEADKKAIELMLTDSSQADESVKYGITCALCALLFLEGKLSKNTHPDSDNRIIVALDGLELDEDDTCWLVACASLSIWENHYGLQGEWKDQGSFKQTFLYVSRQFD